jgi:hypothetical protein
MLTLASAWTPPDSLTRFEMKLNRIKNDDLPPRLRQSKQALGILDGRSAPKWGWTLDGLRIRADNPQSSGEIGSLPGDLGPGDWPDMDFLALLADRAPAEDHVCGIFNKLIVS